VANCGKCGEDKAPSEFWKNSQRVNGLCIWCKSCFRGYWETPSARVAMRASHQKHRNSHREEERIKCREYKEKNRVQINDRRRTLRASRIGEERLRERSWYEANKTEILKRKYSPNGRYITSRYQAKRRGIEWGISKEFFFASTSRPCSYCGGSLPRTGCGLDRKNNSVGYTEDNSVPCCFVCNRVKGHIFSYEEMISIIGPAIKKARELRGGKFVLKYFVNRNESVVVGGLG